MTVVAAILAFVLPGGTAPIEAAVPAVRTAVTVQVAEPPPQIPVDPLAGLYGTFQCRFATAGRVTPCCPDATPILAAFWSGHDLAVADYIIGREGGCKESIVNEVGCVGWWQMCHKSCPPNGCGDAWSSTVKAKELYDQSGWCRHWFLAGDPVTGRGGAGC